MLTSYISEYLAPKNLRLEFKNRIENLCSLSGIPMSPDLRQWVIQTFGLEMVRVIEGYSSLTAPVLSPQLQERINRIVPKNYQGEDVNLLFKQKFDVTCASVCLFYTGVIADLTCAGFSGPGWDFNGFGIDFNACAASFGGYAVQDGSYQCPFYFDTNSQVSFYYIGTSAPPDLIVYDPNLLQNLNIPFSSACAFGCLTTGSVKWNNSPYEFINLSPGAILADFDNWGGQIDFSLGAQAVEDILVTMLTNYQPQASVNVIDDGGGFFTITFIDFYYNPSNLTSSFQFFYNSGFNFDTCDMTPC